MVFHLDTNACIALINNNPAKIRDRFRQILQNGENVYVSSIVLYELWFGIAKSNRRERSTTGLMKFLEGSIQTISFNDDDARLAGEIRGTLEKAGNPIGAYDVLIAAHALRCGATLVTANHAEFSRIEGLNIENWLI